MAMCIFLMHPPPQLPHKLACRMCPALERKEVWNLFNSDKTGCDIIENKMQIWLREIRGERGLSLGLWPGSCNADQGTWGRRWLCLVQPYSAPWAQPGISLALDVRWSVLAVVLSCLHPLITVLRGGLTSWAMLAWSRPPVLPQSWRKGVHLLMCSWLLELDTAWWSSKYRTFGLTCAWDKISSIQRPLPAKGF